MEKEKKWYRIVTVAEDYGYSYEEMTEKEAKLASKLFKGINENATSLSGSVYLYGPFESLKEAQAL